jgi:hypothetical protein
VCIDVTTYSTLRLRRAFLVAKNDPALGLENLRQKDKQPYVKHQSSS